jgi:hypothetical protein
MTEVDWGSEGKQAPKRKKRIPGWMWFCGGGCLLAVLAAIGLTIAGGVFVKDMMDPEKQWESLGRVLPVDGPPDDVAIFNMSWAPGIKHGWQLQRGEDFQSVLMVLEGEEAEEVRAEFERAGEGGKLKQVVGVLGDSEVSTGTLDVQGRTVPIVRFTPVLDEGASTEAEGAVAVMKRSMNPAAVALDLSTEGSGEFVIFTYKKLTSAAPVSDEELLEFLQPFHIGPNR